MWIILLQMSHGLDLKIALFQVDPSLCVLAAVSAVGLGQSPQRTGGAAVIGGVTRGHTTLFSCCRKVTSEDAPPKHSPLLDPHRLDLSAFCLFTRSSSRGLGTSMECFS